MTVFFLKKILAVLAILMTCGTASALPPYASATPMPSVSMDQEQLKLVWARYDAWNRRNNDLAILAVCLAVLGTGCALWAHSECRNPFLWFLAGFCLNFVALVLIFQIHRRHRGKKRMRRVVSYWYVSR